MLDVQIGRLTAERDYIETTRGPLHLAFVQVGFGRLGQVPALRCIDCSLRRPAPTVPAPLDFDENQVASPIVLLGWKKGYQIYL